MAGFRDRDKQKFPLENLRSVVDLFKGQLSDCKEPDVTLLSLVLGTVENALTVNRSVSHELASDRNIEPIFPVLQLSTIEALYQRFVTIIKGSVDLTCYNNKYATRDFVKKVSDVVWIRLTRTYYKDKAHIQSLYSYLTGKATAYNYGYAVHSLHCAVAKIAQIRIEMLWPAAARGCGGPTAMRSAIGALFERVH